MTALVKKYQHKSADDWPPLFFRILSNKIRDLQRRQNIRQRFSAFIPAYNSGEGEDDAICLEELSAHEETPERTLEAQEQLQQVSEAMQRLPKRQHEVFVMRTLEGLSVQQCASALGLSEGSIKTHLSRAMHSIRAYVGADGMDGLGYEQ